MTGVTPDAVRGWVDRLPPRAQLYARLARLDRPTGWWLLFWPCLIGAFMAAPAGWWAFWLLFIPGAIAMRAAGCVYNDIVDVDLDRQVWRTIDRPIASGAVSIRQAWAFIGLLLLVGLGVLLALPGEAQVVALSAILLVLAYPFMKRITWWPQAWLGLTFNWGLPVGWAAAYPLMRADAGVMLLAYAGCWFWTMGYDTIYALQDIEDDIQAGVKSSARKLGRWVRPAVAFFFVMTTTLLAAAMWRWQNEPLLLLACIPVALHFLWQVVTLQAGNHQNTLRRFKSNVVAGALLLLPVLAGAFLLYSGHDSVMPMGDQHQLSTLADQPENHAQHQ